MKRVILLACIACAATYLPAVHADEDSADTHVHNDVTDSLITAKVKSKLEARHMSTLSNIKVNTDEHGVVWLSGRAPTRDASDLAATIAKDTDGVTSVRNRIAIAP